jgi:hypothetical protein
MNNYNVSISGGNEKARTYLSFGYTNQEGIIQRVKYERYTSRVNMDYDISSRLKIGVSSINFNLIRTAIQLRRITDAECSNRRS